MGMVAGWGRRRLGAEGGFTLIELIVVSVVLLVVLAGLTQLFTSGTNAEVDQNNRVQAQQQVRVGLDRLRREARCASTVTLNSASSVTMTLPGWCVRTALTSAVTIPSTGLSNQTISVVNSAGFGSTPIRITFANANIQTSVTCSGIGVGAFTGCNGGGDGVGNQTYSVGAIVTNTVSTTVSWCIPTSGAGSTFPYALDRFVGSCGAGSAGIAYAQNLLVTTLTDNPLTVPPSGVYTVDVASTSGFQNPTTGSYTIGFGTSSPVTCTGATATSFTGCTGGTVGTYAKGTLVFVPIFTEGVVPVAATTVAASGGALGQGSYFYDVTAVLGTGVEVPGTVTPLIAIASGTANKVTLTWAAYPGAASYNIYGRDTSGVRLLRNVPSSTLSFVDLGPTTTTDNPLTLPSSTINVVNTAGYNSGANTIVLGPSGTINCTGTTSTSFTGCSGGQAGKYPSGMTVQNASTVRPPDLTLGVTLKVSTRPHKATGASAFTLVDNIALRNSRPF